MRTFALVAASVALLGAAPQAQAASGVPGRFIADTDIVAAPGGAVVGKGWNGQRVTINCQAPDRNWWHLNAPGAVGWVWQPGQVLREYGTPDPRIC
ncbi:hypothetical protein GCM10022247_54520 [Allokutzneria multivorans]|uniref:SH3 domain-containing protein n=1 Tax=Allokutzneria multivorans TaxID=1142134 RepID=A0ABP7TAH5_9PSEU